MVCVFNSAWNWLTNNTGNVIALCAFGATFWQAHLSRVHNKLSVKPYLTTWTINAGNDGFYSLKITNNGVGSALIKTFEMYVDEKKIMGQPLELIDNALVVLFPKYTVSVVDNSYLSYGYMMAPKDEHYLFKIQFLGSTFPSQAEIEFARSRFKIIIQYESIYKEVFTYDSSKFEVLN